MELMHVFEGSKTNEHLLKIILDEDELSWQQIIYDLVRSEQMDPWDIDIKTITQQFLSTIRKLSELDFRVSGKMVLASALLLKIKSKQLMEEDFQALDQLIAQTEEPLYDEEFFEFDHELFQEPVEPEKQPKIYPRTPQPRQRKVSVYDLVDALEQALDVRVKREKRALDRVEAEVVDVRVPEKSVDVSSLMNSLLEQISTHFSSNDRLTFSHLVPAQSHKQDKVLTFIPLLHLTNERRVDLAQEESFAEIHISLLSSKPVVYSEELEEAVVS